jgi:adenylate cyclase
MPTEQNVTRKLRAILSADVKGYSILMADDEVATIQTLKDYRKIMSACIEQRSGRVVDAVGDNLLAEFESAVDAVQCAVAVQKKLKEKNQGLSDNKRLEFRIGINIGDVILDGDRIFGNGVNIAARIEGIADPGGICISRNTYNHVKDKLELSFEFLGEHEFKNIKEQVRVYKILQDLDSTGILLDEPLELPDKPAIAVLPFVNMSGDPSQEYFSDGLTEQIINGICKAKNLFVIARNSSFAYKGKSISVKQIAQKLGVNHILEGSVQRAGNRVRITAQLIDATNGYHLWSENYDREISDIFALQDDITMKIITALNINLTQGDQAQIYAKGTRNLEVYLKVLQGLRQWHRVNKEGNAIAQKLAKEAISLDSSYPAAYYLLARTQMREVLFGSTNSPKLLLKLSIENAQEAISLDDSFAEAQALLGWLYTMIRQHEKGIDAAERALALNPNSAPAYRYLALTLNYAGRHVEAIEIYKKAIRISPIPSADSLFNLCVSCRNCGRYEEGIAAAKKAIHLEPDNIYAHMCLAGCYALLGRDAEAKAESAEVMRIDPKFSVTNIEKQAPYKHPADTELLGGSLRKAGLK